MKLTFFLVFLFSLSYLHFFVKNIFQVIEICAAIINIFHLIPAASNKLIEPLIQMVLKVENALLVNIMGRLFTIFCFYVFFFAINIQMLC